MEDGKEKLHTQSVAVQVELSVQQALLETSQVESMEIRERQEEAEQSYREVAHQMSEAKSQLGEAKTRCHQLEVAVAGKELEIQRLMSAIHTSKAQVWVCHACHMSDGCECLLSLSIADKHVVE